MVGSGLLGNLLNIPRPKSTHLKLSKMSGFCPNFQIHILNSSSKFKFQFMFQIRPSESVTYNNIIVSIYHEWNTYIYILRYGLCFAGRIYTKQNDNNSKTTALQSAKYFSAFIISNFTDKQLQLFKTLISLNLLYYITIFRFIIQYVEHLQQPQQ